MRPPNADASLAQYDVSCETMRLLERYVDLLVKWNRTINLVSHATLADVWARHIQDSAQLWALAQPSGRSWADFGSGGGLPGIVLSAMAKERSPETIFTLVESDQRKCTFLRTAIRELGLNSQVIADRVEGIAPLGADVVSARALAPLKDLLAFADRHLSPTGVAIFPKGRTAATEIEEAKRLWSFDCDAHPSMSDSAAKVLVIRNIARA